VIHEGVEEHQVERSWELRGLGRTPIAALVDALYVVVRQVGYQLDARPAPATGLVEGRLSDSPEGAPALVQFVVREPAFTLEDEAEATFKAAVHDFFPQSAQNRACSRSR
jgi:hypothetical protein